MNNMYALSTSIAFVYFVIRFAEMRTSKKDPVPLKSILKDTMVVFAACIMGGFLLDQVSPYMADTSYSSHVGGASPAFTDNPNF